LNAPKKHRRKRLNEKKKKEKRIKNDLAKVKREKKQR